MSSDQKYDRENVGLYVRRVQHGPTTRTVRGATCSHPGCEARIEIPEGRAPKPPLVVHAMIAKKGWELGKKGSYLCPEHKKGCKVTTKESEVRNMTKEQRRVIFREIDENYAGKAYVPGVTDKTIGEKLKMPWAWVSAVREENFGPAGLDPELQRALSTVDELEARIKQMETDALAAFEGSCRQIGDVAKQLADVRASLVKFAS